MRELKAAVAHPDDVRHKTVAFGHCSLQSQTPSTTCFQGLPEVLQQHSRRGVKNGYCVELRQHCTAVTREGNQKGAAPPLQSRWELPPFELTGPYFDLSSRSLAGEKFCLLHSMSSIPWSSLVFQCYKVHSAETLKNLVLKVPMAEEGRKSKRLIHNPGVTGGDVLLYFSAAVNSLPMHSCLVLDVPQ